MYKLQKHDIIILGGDKIMGFVIILVFSIIAMFFAVFCGIIRGIKDKPF